LLIQMGNASQVDATAELRSQMARRQAFNSELLRQSLTRLPMRRTAWQPALTEMALSNAWREQQGLKWRRRAATGAPRSPHPRRAPRFLPSHLA
jgi:hypothetical protein